MVRSQKDWRKREKKVMKGLGVSPQPLSGAGWILKEDGESEDFLVQLKSTDGVTYRVSIDDINTLIKNAMVANKTPVFVIDFAKYGYKLVCLLDKDLPKIFEKKEIEEIEEIPEQKGNVGIIELG